MANSELLKEAIADAKAVREIAIQNARLALEEAFTPKLQSILSKKLQAEMEDEEYEDTEELEELDASKVGTGDNVDPASQPDTELDPETQKQTSALGAEDANNEKVDDLTEAEEDEEEFEDPTGATYDVNEDEDEEDEELDIDVEDDEVDDEFEDEVEDEDELDLESIIRELEDELDDEDEVEMEYEAEEEDDEELDIELEDDEDEELDVDDLDVEEDMDAEVDVDLDADDDEIDLDEILREMGLLDEEEEEYEDDEEEVESSFESRVRELEGELGEAYDTIKSLKGTINEVNLLNAKLLFANKLFRNYNLTNEQKVKVVENLDRTNSVREVKLVYATLSESLKFGGNVSKKAKRMTEGFASKASNTTAPTNQKEILSEGNELAQRFKELAGLINK